MNIASATDIASGARFLFHQTLFDLICSDLDALRLSRARGLVGSPGGALAGDESTIAAEGVILLFPLG